MRWLRQWRVKWSEEAILTRARVNIHLGKRYPTPVHFALHIPFSNCYPAKPVHLWKWILCDEVELLSWIWWWRRESLSSQTPQGQIQKTGPDRLQGQVSSKNCNPQKHATVSWPLATREEPWTLDRPLGPRLPSSSICSQVTQRGKRNLTSILKSIFMNYMM